MKKKKHSKSNIILGLADRQPISFEYIRQVNGQRDVLLKRLTDAEKSFNKYIRPRLHQLQLPTIEQSVHFIADRVAFIVDYDVTTLPYVIEVNGSSHYKPRAKEYDAWRDKMLFDHAGKTAIRLSNKLVLTDPDAALAHIITTIDNTCPSTNSHYQKVIRTRQKHWEKYDEPVGLPPVDLDRQFMFATEGL